MARAIQEGFGKVFWIESCYTCKTEFAMSDAFYRTAIQGKEKVSFHCPFGHEQHYVSGKTEAEKLRDQLDEERRKLERERQNSAYLNDEIESQKRQTAYQKGLVTKLKNRSRAGLCPCCNRHFTNLERHMAGKHPEFHKETEEAKAVQ